MDLCILPLGPHIQARLHASSSHSFASLVAFLAPEAANTAQDWEE